MALQGIPFANLALALLPVFAVIAVMHRWGVGTGGLAAALCLSLRRQPLTVRSGSRDET